MSSFHKHITEAYATKKIGSVAECFFKGLSPNTLSSRKFQNWKKIAGEKNINWKKISIGKKYQLEKNINNILIGFCLEFRI
ncbi:MAG: hypothetical protein AAB530_01905 [Patescibacteria group bacterium]